MSEIPNTPLETPIEYPDLSALWGRPLQATHCPHCGVAHLIPAEMERALCPACFEARLEPQPSINRPEAPELLINFSTNPAQVQAGFETWLKGVWLRPKELQPGMLAQRLTHTFIPMWLVDGGLSGTWQAQMGYDYQVASSQEAFRNGKWSTRKLTETRIRWEPRAGSAERSYQNLNIPALEEHTRLARGLGKFNLEAALGYSPAPLENASVRVPSLLPEAAWPQAQSGFERLAAQDCQRAAQAQHIDEFSIQAQYQNLNWTQLLLPIYTTAYRDEQGKVYPILINGQTGKIFGVRHASQPQARNWSLGFLALALFCFVIGLLSAAAATQWAALGIISLLFFGGALLAGIVAPIPAFWAWNFNRKQEGS